MPRDFRGILYKRLKLALREKQHFEEKSAKKLTTLRNFLRNRSFDLHLDC
jgi:hypothetical protein